MKSKADIVQGGGWVTHETLGRPKARFFTFLSVVGGAVSLCAGMLVWAGLPELAFFGRWTCIFLIALELSSIVLAVVFRFIEKPRPLVEHLPNPDHDARKLY
jgi:hypothetical protein